MTHEYVTLGQMLRGTVATFGDRPAFTALGKNKFSWTYREVFAKVGSYAKALQEFGLQRGDRIGIVAENSAEWLSLIGPANALAMW